MAILAFDIGGTSVKYGVWTKGNLIEKDKFKTPKTWEEMKDKLLKVKEKLAERYHFGGVAFSAPGAVNQSARQIEGTSAVPYLHFFPIYDELEALFELPVTMENDANSAGLAEVWKGSAKNSDMVLFVVIGSGIGGAVIANKEVHHGPHLFGGEFGYMLLNEEKTFSQLGTAVAMAKRYAKRKNMSPDDIDGQQVFQLAEQGDPLAKEEVDTFFYYLAMGLYNLAYSFDPEKIVIGGGVSHLDGLMERLNESFKELLERLQWNTFIPVLELCTFKSDANLIGATYHFMQKNGLLIENAL